jgi:deoxyribonuclease-4
MYEMAAFLEASCAQVFTRNPRGGKRREIEDAEIEQANDLRRQNGFNTLICHVPYTVNPASPRVEALNFAKQVLRDDLRHADRFGGDFVVFHPGSHVNSGLEAGIGRIVETIKAALDDYDGHAILCLEHMAGGGSVIGSDPAELAAILEALNWDERLGICIDTCHLFAAGFDVRTKEAIDATLEQFDKTVGVGRIKCVHLNDSLTPLGSKKDRHAMIGKGELGLAGIKAVVSHPVLSILPLCLETPVEKDTDYATEMESIRMLL